MSTAQHQIVPLGQNPPYVNSSPADQYTCGASRYLSVPSISQCQWCLRKKSMEYCRRIQRSSYAIVKGLQSANNDIH
ncbi:hypothetical protein AMELA_G00158070 [Ameiurus melas]|uniref:Uncharacterized protein n=1 Tax=Ameiurus melas TaxID=219545 RepID=A0A7J6AEB6_AMEME|nr:hypothetical protein AMELA_G00158070 [Ameiurus melas]